MNRDFALAREIIQDHKLSILATYRIMGICASPNFRVFVSKSFGLFFADFNFRGRQRARKISSILFRKNHRVGGTTRLSLDRSNVWKKKSPAKVSEMQRNERYLQSDRQKQNNEMSVLLACYVVSYDTFCHKTIRGVF